MRYSTGGVSTGREGAANRGVRGEGCGDGASSYIILHMCWIYYTILFTARARLQTLERCDTDSGRELVVEHPPEVLEIGVLQGIMYEAQRMGWMYLR